MRQGTCGSRAGRWLLGLVAAMGALGAAPGRALGSVTLGQLDPGTPAANCTRAETAGQLRVATGVRYYVPAPGGVITSWSHKALAGSPPVQLKVLRLPSPGTNQVTVAGQSNLEAQSPDVGTFPTRIPVAERDFIGMATAVNGSWGCSFFTGLNGDTYALHPGNDPPGTTTNYLGPYGQYRLNVTARLEPDADRDGFGDESQDQCPSNAATQGPCPPPPPPPPPAARDSSPAALSSCTTRTQDIVRHRAVKVCVIASEGSTDAARGTIRIAGVRRVFALKAATRNAPAQVRVTLRLALTPKARVAVRSAQRRGRRVSARVKLTNTDRAGNVATRTLRVLAKPAACNSSLPIPQSVRC